MSRIDRITSDPEICHGQPTVRNLRYPVANLLELLASGMTIQQILEDCPDLERDDLLAALEYGALAVERCRTVPSAATAFERITFEPSKTDGQACIRGYPLTVSHLVRLMAAGQSFEEIQADFPLLEIGDVREALQHAQAEAALSAMSLQAEALGLYDE